MRKEAEAPDAEIRGPDVNCTRRQRSDFRIVACGSGWLFAKTYGAERAARRHRTTAFRRITDVHADRAQGGRTFSSPSAAWIRCGNADTTRAGDSYPAR